MVKLCGLPKSILVCDDDEGIRKFLGEYLYSKNYKIHMATNAQEGAKAYIKALRNKEKIDTILTDIEMPAPLTSFRRTYTGIDMVKGLEKQFGLWVSNSQIIYMTGDINGYLSQIQPYARWIAKPFTISGLEQVMGG
jgi:CheY-like chemotaxis protein